MSRQLRRKHEQVDVFQDTLVKMLNTNVPTEIVNKFLKEYYKRIRTELIDGYTYRFSSNLGDFCIIKYLSQFKRKPLNEDGTINLKGRKVNWGKTTKMWNEFPEVKKAKKLFYYENDMEYKYGVSWMKYRVKGSELYFMSFKPCRDFDTEVGKAVLSGRDYFLRKNSQYD